MACTDLDICPILCWLSLLLFEFFIIIIKGLSGWPLCGNS